MKFLVYSDLQATDGHERCYTDQSKSLQQWRVEKFYKDLLAVYHAHKCSGLWDLGDTLDDRNAIPIPTINAVLEGIDRFPDAELNLKLIGNHEQYVKSTDVHIGRLFDRKFALIPGVERFDFGGVQMALCSFPENPAKTTAWLEALPRKKPTIILGHFQLVGSELNNGISLEGIRQEAVSWADIGLFGHVHKHQRLCKNTWYVGSPFQQNFGEAGQPKFVVVVDLDTLELEWVKLPGFPEYRVVGMPDFESMCTETSEDRFQVVLKGMADTEQYFSSPLAHRASPVYQYDCSSKPEDASGEENGGLVWTAENLFTRYMLRTPPSTRGIQLPDTDMLEFGKSIGQPET